MQIIKQYILILAALLPTILVAQNDDVGNWIMYFGANKISDKFSLHTEIQYRNHTLIPNNTEQWLLRTGINYHFAPNAIATAGIALIPSYVFESEQSDPETVENRLWQQFILTNKVGRVKFEHRYRLEQRWVNDDYRNRFRYRVMLFIPLNKTSMEPGAIFLGLYDEIFINDEPVFFDRNRLYGALGYQFSKTTSAQVGLLNQRVNAFNKYYLQFAVVYNPDFRKK